MQHLNNCRKPIMILAVLFLLAINVRAQQTSVSTLTVTQKSGKIYVFDGAQKKMVAATANNIQPTAGTNHVFYINNAVSSKMTIKAYDVASNTTTDVVKAETLNSGRPSDKKITNMAFDKVANRLYFSTVTTDAQGRASYLTWYLDEATNEIKIFADGKINTVDNNGDVHTDIYGEDTNGTFVQSHVNTKDGTPGKMNARKYTITSANTSSN